MRIINETQLDFSDLLISPKRSTINSRSEVSLFRDFTWTDSTGKEQTLNCIPIIIANMATIGTPEMAKIASQRGFMTALEKHYDFNTLDNLYTDLEKLAEQNGVPKTTYTQRIAPSIGVKETPDIISRLCSKHDIKAICIDVPNGYIPRFIERVKEISNICPSALIFAGNVVTGDICQDIILQGNGQCPKVGIGGGCFLGDMKVLTSEGLKKISEIEIGTSVLTHLGTYEKVVNKFIYTHHKEIIDINGIKCTPNHKFYAINIENPENACKENNCINYCSWVEAQDLNPLKHMLCDFSNGILEFKKITKSEIMTNDKKTYDLEVERAHSYNIEGIIVHNSACTTRLKTAVGRPQASTVIECADACHQVNGFCCSDGGCKSVGDIAKAFGCGADFVMLGGMFAGAEEANGKVVYIDNKPHKEFYGMSSNLAQERHFGGRRPSSTSEGREKFIPVVGPLSSILDDIEGGIKSCMTYIGARQLKNIPKNCTFYKVNSQLNMTFANCKDIR